MHSLGFSVRLHAAPILAAILVATVAGCGSSSGSRNPSPRASDAAIDSFTRLATASDFQYQGPISGTLTLDGTSVPVTGTSKAKGQDASTSLSYTLMGQTMSQDQVTVGAATYSRANGGSWSKTSRHEASFADLLGAGMKLADRGVETKFGQQLHRLEPTNLSQLDLASLGGGAPEGTSDYQISLIVWVKDDGTPAGLSQSQSYVVDANSLRVAMSLDFTFESLSGVTIEAPSL
jgi:hypothetical protein